MIKEVEKKSVVTGVDTYGLGGGGFSFALSIFFIGSVANSVGGVKNLLLGDL